jgi:hypothetical protein
MAPPTAPPTPDPMAPPFMVLEALQPVSILRTNIIATSPILLLFLNKFIIEKYFFVSNSFSFCPENNF